MATILQTWLKLTAHPGKRTNWYTKTAVTVHTLSFILVNKLAPYVAVLNVQLPFSGTVMLTKHPSNNAYILKVNLRDHFELWIKKSRGLICHICRIYPFSNIYWQNYIRESLLNVVSQGFVVDKIWQSMRCSILETSGTYAYNNRLCRVL